MTRALLVSRTRDELSISVAERQMASFLQSTSPGAGLTTDGLEPEQIFLFENHDAAYHIWRRAEFSGRTLVHIDGHHDMWRVPGYETINIANFISFALKDKIVKDVF